MNYRGWNFSRGVILKAVLHKFNLPLAPTKEHYSENNYLKIIIWITGLILWVSCISYDTRELSHVRSIEQHCKLPYSRKRSRKKTFANFAVLWRFVKSFLREICGRGILWRGRSEQSTKVFAAKVVFFTNLRKFSPLKVFCYTVSELLAWYCECHTTIMNSPVYVALNSTVHETLRGSTHTHTHTHTQTHTHTIQK